MHIFSESAFVTLGKLIEKTANLFNIPGLSCAIVRSGHGVNYLNVGTVAPGTHDDLPVTENTIFKIGSISKSVLGTALGILETKGLLDLSKDIADLLELDAQEKEFFRGVTPLHILTHTSGVAAFSSSMQAFLGIPGEKIRQSLPYLPKTSRPGDKFQYHNGLYWLLAELVEKTTGSKWRDWITQAIFERLDMKTTGFAVCPKLMAKPFCCYTARGDNLRFFWSLDYDSIYIWHLGYTIHIVVGAKSRQHYMRKSANKQTLMPVLVRGILKFS